MTLQMTAHVSKICSRSEDRIGCGFSVTVLTRCTGGKDNLFQDSIRMTLQTGTATLHLVFPIAVSLKQLCCLMLLNEWWLSWGPSPLAMLVWVTQELHVLVFGPTQHLLGGGREAGKFDVV